MQRTGVFLVLMSVFLLGLTLTDQAKTIEGELVSAKCYLRAGQTGKIAVRLISISASSAASMRPVISMMSSGVSGTLILL